MTLCNGDRGTTLCKTTAHIILHPLTVIWLLIIPQLTAKGNDDGDQGIATAGAHFSKGPKKWRFWQEMKPPEPPLTTSIEEPRGELIPCAS